MPTWLIVLDGLVGWAVLITVGMAFMSIAGPVRREGAPSGVPGRDYCARPGFDPSVVCAEGVRCSCRR